MKNGFFQSKGEFSVKNSSQQDCYFKNMNDFVDDKLEMVVEKIAEKKSLYTVNNTLRVVVDKLETENTHLEKEKSELEGQYDKAFTINRDSNAKCDDLLEQVTMLRENLESYRISENANINVMREEENDLRVALADNKQHFNLDKNLWNDELKGQRDDIVDLEDENKLAHVSLKDMHAKYKYCGKLEKEKLMVFKEKNKILDQLVHEERATLKSTSNKRVFDITKNFCKKLDQRKISQAIDTTRGVIDLSNTRLLNITLNSNRNNAFERTYMSAEKFKSTPKQISKRSSMDAYTKSISHNTSKLYE